MVKLKGRFNKCPCCQRGLGEVPPMPEDPAEGYPAGGDATVCTCAAETSVKSDFYEHTNRDWLMDPSITIPEEYPRWGSFIILVDEALKNQIGILNELVGASSASEDEAKLATIWRASMARFASWEAGGGGDYKDILAELSKLSDTMPEAMIDSDDGGDSFALGCAAYFSRCQQVGIKCPLTFGKEANLTDTENIVLDLSPSGTSLPSRDYYVDEKFSSQRTWFREHIQKVVDLVGVGNFEDDFVNRVVRFETKLAQVSMKPDQSRQFDQYFTITTLDDLKAKVNELKHLKDKNENYGKNEVDEAGEDKDILKNEEFVVGDDDKGRIGTFWDQMFLSLQLRERLEANYAKNYPGKDAEAQYRLMAFDGDFFRRALCLFFKKCNRRDLKAYMQYQIVRSAKEFCTKPLNEEFFDFYARKLGGQKEQKTAEKRTMNLVNSWVGELMGKIYVKRFFSEEDKNTVGRMVNEVLDIMKVSLKKNDWLTETTKAKALVKLEKFVVKLGYPDKVKSFDSLDLKSDDSMFSMQMKVNKFEYETEFLDKINSVKDKSKWEMSPQDVNAYFHPLNNEIVFPAAIMQPPFYHRSLKDVKYMDLGSAPTEGEAGDKVLSAINFGGIGAVIAHEITHGYDDQGRKFDSDGNINDWWQEEDAKLFKTKCALMTEQAEKWTFEDVPEEGSDSKETKTHRMNGELTMGENLADLGGMSLAVQALKKHYGDDFAKDTLVNFFSSWANVWKSKETKAFTIKALATDPHAPCSFRANLVSNVDAFYDVFEVVEGDPMYIAADKRVRMW